MVTRYRLVLPPSASPAEHLREISVSSGPLGDPSACVRRTDAGKGSEFANLLLRVMPWVSLQIRAPLLGERFMPRFFFTNRKIFFHFWR